MDDIAAASSIRGASGIKSVRKTEVRTGGRLPGLDWLRGLAAMWVLVYHFDITIQKAKYFDAASLGPFAQLGYHGVDLFFVLSGFVMAASTPSSAKNDFVGVKNFLVRRMLRIFPPYLAVSIPLMLIAAITGVGAPDAPLDASLVLQNLFLLPRDDLTTFVPVVSWTLTHELMFYFLFALTFVSFRIAASALGLWSVACLATYVAGGAPAGWAMQLSVLNIYFLVGVLACHASSRIVGGRRLAGGISLLLLGGAACLETKVLSVGAADAVAQAILYGGAFTLMIFSFAPVPGRVGMMGKILDALGRQSYSIYLVHYPIIVIVAMVLTRLDPPGALPIAFLLSVGGTLVVSWILFRLVEHPAISLGRMLTRRPWRP